MDQKTIVSVILFVIAATITPGGATTLATSSGTQFGFRRSIPLLAGIAVGLASLAAAAAAGLSSILLGIPSLQLAMRVAGSVYLFWLAWQIARSGPPTTDAGMSKPTNLLGGALLLWLNPKGWAMALGAAASFSPRSGSLVQIASILALAFGIAASISLSIWCAAGLLLARLLRTSGQWRVVNALMGLLILASIVPIWLK